MFLNNKIATSATPPRNDMNKVLWAKEGLSLRGVSETSDEAILLFGFTRTLLSGTVSSTLFRRR